MYSPTIVSLDLVKLSMAIQGAFEVRLGSGMNSQYILVRYEKESCFELIKGDG